MDLILDFTHAYSQEWIQTHGEMTYIGCSDLGGTDMYCSPEAVLELEERIGKYPLQGIHFIDSGNYHYMTRLFTKRIQKPYVLVFFDNHTDCQPTMIPELLSCGAWAKEVLEEDEYLRQMILIGPPQSAIDEIEFQCKEQGKTEDGNRGAGRREGENGEVGSREDGNRGAGSREGENGDNEAGELKRLVTISREELEELRKLCADTAKMRDVLWDQIKKMAEEKGILTTTPLYISIDKDVLSEEFARTNWDQGQMSLWMLKEILSFFFSFAFFGSKKPEVLGVDICGELPEKETSLGEAAKAQRINQKTNEELIVLCRSVEGLFYTH